MSTQAIQDALGAAVETATPEHKPYLTALWERLAKAKAEGKAHKAAETPAAEKDEQDDGDEDETCDECGAKVGPNDKKCKVCGADLEDDTDEDEDEDMEKALATLAARGFTLTDEDGNVLGGEPLSPMPGEDLAKSIGEAVTLAVTTALEPLQPLLKALAAVDETPPATTPPPADDPDQAAENADALVVLRKSYADTKADLDAKETEIADLRKNFESLRGEVETAVVSKVNAILDATPVPAGRPAQVRHSLLNKTLVLGSGADAETIDETTFEKVLAKAIVHGDPNEIGTMRLRFGTPEFEIHRARFEEMRKTFPV